MIRSTGISIPAIFLLAILPLGVAWEAAAQTPTNPYRANYEWGDLPDGRSWGAVSALYPSPDGNIWIAERCGQNTCIGSDVDPILLMDPEGNVLRSFGAGMFAWPHQIYVDGDGHVWVIDGNVAGATEAGLGNAVFKFTPEGELLLTLGTPGEPGEGPDRLTRPNDVVVAQDGTIFLAEGHGPQEPNRVRRYSAEGSYLGSFGETGYGPGQFLEPHHIAMDSRGRLFVADRYNNRIQILDQEGNFIAFWTQFGRPSGIYIDPNDIIYVADSESGPAPNDYTGQRNAGWERGIRVGDARTGWVFHFIPESWTSPTMGVMSFSGPEGVAVDRDGNIYAGEVSQRRVIRYDRIHPPLILPDDREP